MLAEKPETESRADGVRDSDSGYRELGTDLQRQDRSEQAADAESAHRGDRAREDANNGKQEIRSQLAPVVVYR
jgi:hypothetical protein